MKTPDCIRFAQHRSTRSLSTHSKSNTRRLLTQASEHPGPSKVPKAPPNPEHLHAPPPVAERTAYHLYLREIGQIPLLTPEQEVALALRVQQGDDLAREHMIKANLRLVVKIAREYEGMGVPLLDLINEGNIGLMKAVERFDPEKGAKLSTYGALWIKQAIKRALANQGRDIRLPVHVHDKLSGIQSCILRYYEAHRCAPTPEEIGKEIGLPTRKVMRLLESSKRPTSLDAKGSEGEGSNEFGNAIADERAEDPYETLERQNALSLLKDFIQFLKPRELQILIWRFGLEGEPSETLEQIGQRLKLTREAVRQIQNRALMKLRAQFQKLDQRPVLEAMIAMAA